jgi:hypothetical protein
MNRRARGPFRFAFRACLVASLVLATTAVHADPETFGTRTVEIPAPQGFAPIRDEVPAYFQLLESFIPPSNRLVETYVLPEDKAGMLAGVPRNLERYFQMQTLRSIDGTALSPDEFTGAMGEIERAVVATVPTLEAATKDLTAKGNQALQDASGTDAEVSIGGPTYHGVFRREPWGLFFSLSMPVTLNNAGTQETHRVVSSTAVMLADHQLVYLYAYADAKDPDARAWAEKNLSAWADAVRAANPDDPAVAATVVPMAEAGRPWWSNQMLMFGVGALLVVGIVVLLRRAR